MQNPGIMSRLWADPVWSKVVGAIILSCGALLFKKTREKIKPLWQHPVGGKLISAFFAVAMCTVVGIIYSLNQSSATSQAGQIAFKATPPLNSNNVNEYLGQFNGSEFPDQITSARMRILDSSDWTGTTAGIDVPGEDIRVPPFDMKFRFSVTNNIIYGDGSFARQGRQYEIKFIGDIHNEYLRGNYYHLHGVDAFGFIIFKMDQNLTTMSGKCLVLGSATQRITVGTIELTKLQH
jgi:hypothetical protein